MRHAPLSHRQEFTSSGERYEWELFARCYWVDDFTLWLDALLALIAPHVAKPGYGGFVRDEFRTDLKIITFREGMYDPVDI